MRGLRERRLVGEEALLELRDLPGVGAFSSELILVRGAGAPDVLPAAEPRVRAAVRLAYGLAGDPGPGEFTRIGRRLSVTADGVDGATGQLRGVFVLQRQPDGTEVITTARSGWLLPRGGRDAGPGA